MTADELSAALGGLAASSPVLPVTTVTTTITTTVPNDTIVISDDETMVPTDQTMQDMHEMQALIFQEEQDGECDDSVPEDPGSEPSAETSPHSRGCS